MARSALPPFSGWLLGSMSAPTPVSALMHGGFVNAGGFLLIRFGDVLQATPIAQFAAIAAGLLAAIYGTGIMLVRADVKGVLAGSTVAQMGFLVLSCGLGAYGAALWHIIGHALFKSWLFLNAGSTIGLPVRRDRAEFSARTAVLVLLGASAAATVMYLVTPLEQVSLVGMFLALMTLAVAILAAGKTRWVAIALVVPLLGMSLLVAETLDSRLEGPASHQMPIAVPIAIAAVIAIGWIVQQRFAARGLPRPLYLVLLNAGVLHAR
ncbi:hypothetical protein H9L14_03710 [Sphingomonas sediminicola]|uniref:NADH:quinone oxidoreductase/Mrp antiporter transmembrane domain-containing protein n=2 Tax=Sphingomonas sediminicola TaxID=386874 RepID=A0ABX6TAB2_9SPHN|nr:proton-conducting transporter membrane subunit [Sphingomonas sediminicola]QNP46319.1 hypothetical protein H9L14_03710 [Sphingomonas sediminicola]